MSAYRAYHGAERRVFPAPRHEQFARAAHLEAAFHRYAESIGCTVIHDEIMTTTDRQVMLLQNWWAENRL